MTDWRAVAVGLVVLLVVGAIGLTVPGFGQIGAGLIGGFVAGYLAGGGLTRGAWHGLLAGSITGVLFTLLLVPFGGVLGAVGGPLGGLLGGASVLFAGVILTLFFAIDSALAGALGAVVKDWAAD